MSSPRWPREPIPVVQAFESRAPNRGPIGALAVWATFTVEELYYLDDIDTDHEQAFFAGKFDRRDIIDMAHVRWAAASAVTALDLCAAILGRVCCNWTGANEMSLRSLDLAKNPKHAAAYRSMLPRLAAGWVDAVLNDQRYVEIQAVRNLLVHARPLRALGTGGAREERTKFRFNVGAKTAVVPTRKLITDARDLATEYVASFLDVLHSL